MSGRSLISAGALAVAIASMSAGMEPVGAQGPAAGAKPFMPPPSTYTPPRTPWGDPDIQGIWDYQNLVKIERPKELAGKTTLTDEEMFEWVKSNNQDMDVGLEVKKGGNVGAYNEFWNERSYVKDNRTSLLVDPPDGRFPPLTPAAEARRKAILATGYDGTKWASWEDAHPLTRCLAAQTPSGPFMYNGGAYIMQTPGWVMIVRERLDTRFIALDGRKHIDPKIRQWHGDSVGHFEGNVLVVDVTNFSDKQKGSNQFAGHIVGPGHPFGNFHATERFVPIGPNRLHVYSTVEDPTTWTKPWTIMLPYERQPDYQIYEYACNEGNLSVGAGLRGERRLEAAAAAEAAKQAK